MKVGSNMMKTIKSLTAALLAATLIHSGSAGAAGVSWESLDERQRQVLGPLQEHWDEMGPEQRQKAQQRFERWQALTPEQRRQIRKRYERFIELSPKERARMQQGLREKRERSE